MHKTYSLGLYAHGYSKDRFMSIRATFVLIEADVHAKDYCRLTCSDCPTFKAMEADDNVERER